jgi:hypothetical protein
MKRIVAITAILAGLAIPSVANPGTAAAPQFTRQVVKPQLVRSQLVQPQLVKSQLVRSQRVSSQRVEALRLAGQLGLLRR